MALFIDEAQDMGPSTLRQLLSLGEAPLVEPGIRAGDFVDVPRQLFLEARRLARFNFRFVCLNRIPQIADYTGHG